MAVWKAFFVSSSGQQLSIRQQLWLASLASSFGKQPSSAVDSAALIRSFIQQLFQATFVGVSCKVSSIGQRLLSAAVVSSFGQQLLSVAFCQQLWSTVFVSSF